MKKKILVSILMSAMVVGMCACGKEQVPQENNADAAEQNAPAEDDAVAEEEEKEESEKEKFVNVELTDGGTISVSLSSFDGIDLTSERGTVELKVKAEDEYSEDEIYKVDPRELRSSILDEIYGPIELESISTFDDVSFVSASVYNLLEAAYGEDGIEQIKQSAVFGDECLLYLQQLARTGQMEKTETPALPTLIVNDSNITLPCSLDDIRALGYELVQEEEFSNFYDGSNAEGQKLTVCNMEGMDSISSISISKEDGSTVDMNGITLGMSVAACIEKLSDVAVEAQQDSSNRYIRYWCEQGYHVGLYFDEECCLEGISVGSN